MAVIARTAGDWVKAALCDLEISTDGGTSWDDFSAFVTALSVSENAVTTESFKDFTGSEEITDAGGEPSATITVTCIFTKAVNGAFDTFFTAARATDKSCDLRWSRKDAASGENQFTTANGICTSCPPAAFDTSSSGRVSVDATIVVSGISKATIA